MRAVLQRVTSAQVEVDSEVVGSINEGLMILLAVSPQDTANEVEWLTDKVANLRIFNDDQGQMNRSLKDTGGAALIVSQFTLYGDARKGRRPSFTAAAKGEQAETLYEATITAFKRAGIPTESGRFGADMQVTLTNSGPVTILLDSTKQF